MMKYNCFKKRKKTGLAFLTSEIRKKCNFSYQWLRTNTEYVLLKQYIIDFIAF